IDGLGPTLILGPDRRIHRRATVGSASELTQLVSMLLADASGMEPRMFSPGTFAAACRKCGGLGSLREPELEKLIVNPAVPNCDAGGLYTRGVVCPSCAGTRLRAEFLAVTLNGWNRHQLHSAPLVELEKHLVPVKPGTDPAREALATAVRRLAFLRGVGLAY